MARSRRATSDEIELALKSALSSLTEAIRKPSAKLAIAERVQQLHTELEVWKAISQWTENLTEEALNQKLAIDVELIVEESKQADLTVDDLDALRVMFRGIVDALEGRADSVMTANPEVARFLQRAAKKKEPTARRFRPEFEEAFRRRHSATRGATSITVENLAAELMPREYSSNPESAVRNMQQGVRRVELEHARCQQMEIPSPFLPDNDLD
jgi:hypothetical protein